MWMWWLLECFRAEQFRFVASSQCERGSLKVKGGLTSFDRKFKKVQNFDERPSKKSELRKSKKS